MFGFLSFGPFGLLSNSGRVEIRHSISIFYPEGLSVSRKFLTAPLFLSFRHVLRVAIGNRQQTCGWQGQHEQGGEGRTGKGDLNRFSTYRAKRASSDGVGYRRPALDFHLLFWLCFAGAIARACSVAISVVYNTC